MGAITSHDADLGDVRLHYLAAGPAEAEPLVLLHGVPQTAHAWRHLIPHLGDRFRIVAPDLRGLGRSSRPAEGYDKRTVAEDVWRLTRHLGIGRFSLVGHDWGGPVAFALAAHHRDAVARLVILDVSIPGGGTDMSQGGRRWHHPLFRTPDLPEALFEGREGLLLDWFFDTYGHRRDCIPETDREVYRRAYTQPGAMRALLAYYRATDRDAADNEAALAVDGPLPMPVLALGGDSSFGRGLQPLESLRRLARDVRGGVVPGCGHWLAEEAPGFVADRILAFLAEG